MDRLLGVVAMVAIGTTLLTGCGTSTGGASGGPINPGGPSTPATLTAVAPAPSATAVPTNAPLTMTFGQPMMPGMEQFMDLHRGAIADPTVPMACGWNGMMTALACVPNDSLMSATHYTMHIGAGMTDAQGDKMDLSHWTTMGGQWVVGGMMSGTHAGQPMGMMGSDWKDGAGHYGMTFGFTTN